MDICDCTSRCGDDPAIKAGTALPCSRAAIAAPRQAGQAPGDLGAPIVWPRADPIALRHFNSKTKQCTMNCGPHQGDPRSTAERKLLCSECYRYP